MRYSKLGYFGLPVLAVVVMGIGYLLATQLMPPGVSWAKAGLLSLAGIISMGLSMGTYRYGDEIILARTKTAWFWGGLTAVAAAIPLMIGIGWNLLSLPAWMFPPGRDPQVLFSEGMAAMLLGQTVGFLAVRTYARLRSL